MKNRPASNSFSWGQLGAHYLETGLGFTLIELIVSITIMMLIVGGGIASYISFNDRQTLVQAANRLEVVLRSAQSRAASGDRPDTCLQLTGYSVVMTAGTNLLQVQAECRDPDDVLDVYSVPDSSPISLAPSVVLAETRTVTFGVLQGGVENPGRLELVQGSQRAAVDVSAGGSIVSLGLLDEDRQPDGDGGGGDVRQ